jgi:hypothetical protein
MKTICVSVRDWGVRAVSSSVKVVPVNPAPVIVTWVPPPVGPRDGVMELIVACAVDTECGDAENFSAERAAIASIASAAKMRPARNRNHFLANPNVGVELQNRDSPCSRS